jgi:hypothetical protein
MPNDREIAPLDESSNRQIWVGWGSTVAAAFLAYLSGGQWWAYFGVFVGLVIALRGHSPQLFVKHIDAQIIAGIPARKIESFAKWAGWTVLALVLGGIASWEHKKIAPEKPDLAKTIIDGVKKIVEQQNKIPTLALTPAPISSIVPPVGREPKRDELPDDLRANLQIVGVALSVEKSAITTGEGELGWIHSEFFVQNIGRSQILPRAFMSVSIVPSMPLDDKGLNELYSRHQEGQCDRTMADNTVSPGEPPIDIRCRGALIGPSEWKGIESNDKFVIYAIGWTSFGDKYGYRKRQFCITYKWPDLIHGRTCFNHNTVIDVK